MAERPILLIAGQAYPVWSPDRAYEAAAVLLRPLAAGTEVEPLMPRSTAQLEEAA